MEDNSDTGKQAESPLGSSPGREPAPDRTDHDQLKRQYEELNERFLRLAADFENYRKRTSREQEQLSKYANEQLAIDLLEVIDNLDRATESDDSHIRQGLEQIRSLSCAILQRHGITPIDSYERAFDPGLHEAIAHIPSEKCEGTIIDELCKGYRMHDKVIRFAKVAVSKGNRKTEE